MLRSIHQSGTRTTGNAPRLRGLLAVIALAAASCGGGDDTVAIEDVGATDVATDAEEDDDSAGTQVAEPGEGADTATVDDDGEHRPSEALRATIDCDTVATSGAGASILFPDSSDPASLQVGTGPVTVEVVGCSDTFEANVQYDAFHGQDTQPTMSGFTSGGTLGSWEEFSFEETYGTAGDWTVVVFVNDAESGNRIEYDQVTFTVD